VGKIRRGGYVFLSWKGDHTPRHVHVYRAGKLVVKWNLEESVAIKGRASKHLRELIRTLEREGSL